MATIKDTISLQDKVSPVLKTVVKALNSTMVALASVDQVSSTAFDTMKADVAAASAAVDQMGKEVDQLPPGADKAANAFGKLKNPLVTASAAIYTLRTALQTIGQATDLADNFMLAKARLDIMNDGLQTTDELQNMILASANRSRASYDATVGAISRMGILAKDAFSSTTEIVAFTELLNKSFKVGGAGLQEQTSAMYQLSQAMAAGKLQGDEFRSIMENAPMLAEAIAKYTGKTKGELKEMSSQGLITADIIKGALFSAAGDINAKFETMPATFGDNMTRMANMAIEAFQPVFERLSALINTPAFETFLNGVIKGMIAIADATLGMLNIMVGAINWMANNWIIVEPIIWGIVAALIAMKIALLVTAAIDAFTKAQALAAAAGQTLTVTQWALNAAMAANPFGAIAMAIIAVIAALIALGVWLYRMWQTNIDFRVAVIGIWNNIINFFEQIPIFFQWVGNGIADAFGWAKVTVMTMMQDMVNSTIDMVNKMIDALNKIPGVDIKKMDQVKFGAETAAAEAAAKAARDASLRNAQDAAAAKAAQREAELQAYASREKAKAAEEAARLADEKKKQEQQNALGYTYTGPTSVKVDGGDLDSIKDQVDISDEDIKMLKDVAATEFINRYTTMTPNMTITFGDVHETADVNKVVKAIEDMIGEAYNTSLVGG